ncbi:MAG: hypothetical protein ACRDZ8_12895, partial [Acidimicrobiales bacterium]
MATTAGQEARFHLVADRFDRRIRRRVKRLVLQGQPPLEGDIVPLAVAYADRILWTVGQARPTRMFR